MTHRIHNFCAGPCTLPLSVLEEAQQELLDFQGCGMSVMEISHRSQRFEPWHEETLALASELISAPEDFHCLLLPGGAHQQFMMSAANLLIDDQEGGIINTGVWAEKAMDEARRIGIMHEVWSGADSQFTTLPQNNELHLPEGLRYLHVTSNETIGGIQFRQLPEVDVPLVVDVSSDYYTREIPWSRCDIVYGGVQKNLAPAGLALVFVRKSLLRDHPTLPHFLNYETHAKTNSLYNTPPTWQIYILNKVLHWMKDKGGIPYFAKAAAEKSARLYQAIDRSEFYQNALTPEVRSQTNVIFRTPSETMDTTFWKTAETVGLSGLKGHRIVGGLRASLYNALEMASVDALIAYMDDFARQHG